MSGLFDNEDWDRFFNLFPVRNRSVEMDSGNKTFKVAVPGYGKEDLSAKIDDDGVLSVSGDNGESTFERKFRIPGVGVDTKLKLVCDKGILTIKLPEKENTSLTIH